MVSHATPVTLLRYAYALWAMARPAFLLGTFPMYLAGAALARHRGDRFDLATAVLGLALVWTIQLATHYNNEYWDVETDATVVEPTHIAGGSRVLVNGIVSREIARRAAALALVIAGLLSLFISVALDGDLGIIFLAAAAMFGGWFYSSPPLALSSRGVGAVTVALIAGLLVPAIGFYLQASTVSAALWIVCPPLALLSFATSIATSLPDVRADRATGKRTLAVRLGRRPAVMLLLAATAAGWLSFGVAVAVVAASAIEFGVLLPAPVLAGVAVYVAPTVVRGSVDAAETLGAVAIATLGWVSLSLSVLLL